MKTFACALLLAGASCLLPSFAQEQVNLADLQDRAAKGDAEAELDLGRAYHLGKGVPKDYAKAADLYRKAAAQGKAKAMYNLGYIYLHAQGVPEDDAAAAQWIQKSADAGLPAGELWIGLAYYNGDSSLKTDYVAAAKWLKLAVQQTDSPAERGKAANALGYMYSSGLGMPPDAKESLKWYQVGADAGDGKAQFHLSEFYLKGLGGVQKDPVKAYMWLRLACFNQEPLAMHNMTNDVADKVFTDQQIEDGTQMAGEYQRSHGRVPERGPTPMALDPMMSPHIRPAPSAAGTAAATNAPATTQPKPAAP